MSAVGQSRSMEILFCIPKIKEPMMKRSTFSFSHWNRKSKIGDLPFTPETKMPLYSLYPTILNLSHPTLLHILVRVRELYLLKSKFYFIVLNHFCDSWLKIDGLLYFAKSGNTKVTSSDKIIILTRHSLVLMYSQDN